MAHAASPAAPRHSARALLVNQCAGGVAAGLMFAALLLGLNIGSLFSLLMQSPHFVPVFLVGAVIAFAPVVICTSAVLIAGPKSAFD